uniref:Nidogen n=1 Tax=Romanomermis culicivorax TaxID=13658 RepID=A0A915JIK0_ROMCU
MSRTPLHFEMQRFSFTNPLISIVIILIRAPLHFTVPISEFYPFGPENGDSALLQDDEISSEEIKLIFGSFTLFQVEHRKLFVNLNGIISFDTEIPYFSNKAVSAMGYSTIAVFYSDIDTHVTGQPEVVHGRVYYRLTNDSNLLQKFKAKVLSTFHDSRVFDPKSMLIATWHKVGYFPEKHDKKNTFQAILAQGRLHSYVQFLYADDGIQWTASEGKDPHHPEIPAQVGFFNDDGREWPFNISGKESVVNINNLLISSTAQNAENSNELDGQEEDYYNEVVSVSSDDYDDDEEMTEQAKSTLPPAPPVDELMTTTTSVSTEPTENIATSQREAVSTVAPMLETTSESGMAPSTLPPCPDSTYQNGCPHDCTEEVVSSRCTRCNCPDVQDETTQTTSTGSMTTFAPPAAPIDRHDAPPPENAAGYSTNTGNPGAKTCQSAGGSACHPNAQCHDSAVGYCCQCSYGYYGNGIECLPNGIAQRINGKVYGQVNGQELPEMDLHTYAEPSDGRAYTAISKMEPNVGRSFLLLNTLGNVMGWLFAKPSSPGSYNGVELTGVRLNRTATVHIGDSHTVTVQQEFTSRDVLDYMKVKMYVIGNLPELPVNATVDFGEYSEEFNRASPGVVKSYSTSEVAINFPGQVTSGAPLKYSITVDQTIRYDECMAKPFDKPTHIILKTERSYVYYDANEKIVRYASANTVDLRTATQDDPCRANDCDQPHMTCVAQQNVHKCLCLDGYELTFADSYDRKGTCVDIDECSRRTHRCDSNAACHNTEGSYTCICNVGYRGTGYKCISK